MTVVTFVARFPTGEFNAHDADGRPEWPPAPARLLAALLATAYRTGRGVSAVESLFDAPPPRISAPRTGVRDVSFGRWVPVNNELKPSSHGHPRGIVDADGRFQEKQAKTPERGVLVGNGPDEVVRWSFDLPADANVEALRAVARAVEYLGRPTSPVVLDVAECDRTAAGLVPGHDLWIPDVTGWVGVRVGTRGLLAALDAREEERRRSRVTGTHPVLIDRPTETYRVVGEDVEASGSRPDARALLDRCALYTLRLVHKRPVPAADAGLVCGQLAGDLVDDGWVLPILGPATYRTAAVLRGVLTYGLAAEQVRSVVTRVGLTQACLAEPRVFPSLPRVLRAAVAPSSRWTTTVPTGMSPEEVERALVEVAEAASMTVVSAGMHIDAHTEGAVDADEIGGSRHVTVEWDREVDGPVALGPYLMVPEWEPGMAMKVTRPLRR